MYYTADCPSPVGMLTLASDGEYLVGLWIEGQKYFAHSLYGKVSEDYFVPVFTLVKNWLDRYFAGEKPAISEVPLRPGGSEFWQSVWRILCDIPYGEVVTYGSIAKKVASDLGRERMSAQAVGGAVGHNPISIIIPCHRVVGANGSLTGYAGGIDTKVKLLQHEAVDMTHLFIPKKGTAL